MSGSSVSAVSVVLLVGAGPAGSMPNDTTTSLAVQRGGEGLGCNCSSGTAGCTCPAVLLWKEMLGLPVYTCSCRAMSGVAVGKCLQAKQHAGGCSGGECMSGLVNVHRGCSAGALCH